MTSEQGKEEKGESKTTTYYYEIGNRHEGYLASFLHTRGGGRKKKSAGAGMPIPLTAPHLVREKERSLGILSMLSGHTGLRENRAERLMIRGTGKVGKKKEKKKTLLIFCLQKWEEKKNYSPCSSRCGFAIRRGTLVPCVGVGREEKKKKEPMPGNRASGKKGRRKIKARRRVYYRCREPTPHVH